MPQYLLLTHHTPLNLIGKNLQRKHLMPPRSINGGRESSDGTAAARESKHVCSIYFYNKQIKSKSMSAV